MSLNKENKVSRKTVIKKGLDPKSSKGVLFPALSVFAVLLGLTLTVFGISNAAGTFNPPTARPPFNNPTLPSLLSGTKDKLSYWKSDNELGSANGLNWDATNNLLTVNTLRIGNLGGTATGKFLKSADNNGTVTWGDVDPTQFQKRLTFSSGSACPTGQAVTSVDVNGVVTCTPAGGSSGFDFSIVNSSSSVTMRQGDTGIAAGTITVTTTAGVGQVVDFGIDPSTPLPSGVTATFSPTWCASKTSCTSTVTLSATGSATTGTVSFKIKGTSGSITKSTSAISLTVNTGIPYTLTLSACQDYYGYHTINDGGWCSSTSLRPGGSGWFTFNLSIKDTSKNPVISLVPKSGCTAVSSTSLRCGYNNSGRVSYNAPDRVYVDAGSVPNSWTQIYFSFDVIADDGIPTDRQTLSRTAVIN